MNCCLTSPTFVRANAYFQLSARIIGVFSGILNYIVELASRHGSGFRLFDGDLDDPHLTGQTRDRNKYIDIQFRAELRDNRMWQANHFVTFNRDVLSGRCGRMHLQNGLQYLVDRRVASSLVIPKPKQDCAIPRPHAGTILLIGLLDLPVQRLNLISCGTSLFASRSEGEPTTEKGRSGSNQGLPIFQERVKADASCRAFAADGGGQEADKGERAEEGRDTYRSIGEFSAEIHGGRSLTATVAVAP